jgi:S1-C subfamily serine protease
MPPSALCRSVVALLALLSLPVLAEAQAIDEVFRRINPSVVVIKARGKETAGGRTVGFTETGAGVIVSEDGKVVTATHVVKGVVGAPYGLRHSLSVGVISARWGLNTVNADFPLAEFFQTDAAINTGNSGGPMFNLSGQPRNDLPDPGQGREVHGRLHRKRRCAPVGRRELSPQAACQHSGRQLLVGDTLRGRERVGARQ